MTLRTENPLAYMSWRLMRERCGNSECKDWPNYGGRGIGYVSRWCLFENFIADMGERPPGYSIERRDVNGHYGPHNCIWIPKGEQYINKRRAYNPRSGFQIGTLEDLFPPLPDIDYDFIAEFVSSNYLGADYKNATA